ncbi:flavodoxin [Methanosphaera sp. ISO3-F5]|uniref:flavodoxin n=1 Tax=Methanosphaera sp. ISO3-F5 TaxID=1452353 RepID=UPI002B25DA8E|nr:flavodoxin [Methanosphaera sp. ISO3-F5]WQH64183.1 flavodoxin [Methanosphaera sp. ISO3-F5]
MKQKIISILIILIILGCGITTLNAATNEETTANKILNQKNTEDTKILVAYFSRTGENYNVGNTEVGNTAMIASYIKEYLKADSYEIIPVNKYPIGYDECLDIAKKEQQENARPEIQNKVENIDKYDTIIIGYPIWYGDTPMIINTFLEQNNLEGKNILLFNTHEGSQDAGTYKKIAEKMSSSKVNTNGLAVQGQTARTNEGKQQTIEWLKQQGY